MSEELPSGEKGTPGDPAQLPRPEMWPEPPAGQQPRPITGRAEPGEADAIAHRRLPIAWLGVAVLCAAAILLGLAVAMQTWLLAVIGVLVGAVGAGLTLASRIMEAATIGQNPTNE
jgi:hypothetical protein